MAMISTSTPTPLPIPIHPYSGQQWWKYSPSLPIRYSFDTCQPGPPAEKFSISSGLDAVKAHMHVQHKLDSHSKKVSNQLSIKCYTKYQELIRENIVEKDISNSSLKSPLEKMEVPRSAARTDLIYNQKRVAQCNHVL